MKVLIAGANGKIGRRLIPHLVADNIQVRAMVRDLRQKAGLALLGAHEVVEADLEGDCSEALEGQDVVIFTETLTHGTLPWTADHERRALLYKFSPGCMAYSPGAHDIGYSGYIGDMTDEERAVMEAPHARSR